MLNENNNFEENVLLLFSSLVNEQTEFSFVTPHKNFEINVSFTCCNDNKNISTRSGLIVLHIYAINYLFPPVDKEHTKPEQYGDVKKSLLTYIFSIRH